MLRRLSILLVSLLALTFLAAPASPAAARPPLITLAPGTGINLDGTPFKLSARAYNCPVGYNCFYDGTNGSGAAYPIPQSWTGCRTLLGDSMDNRTSSIYNHTNYNWHVWQIHNSGCNEAGSSWSNIGPQSTGNMSSYWNNVITTYERA